MPQSLLDDAWLNFQNDINTDGLDYLIADHLPISVNIKLNIQSSLNKLCFKDISQIPFSKFDNDKDDVFNQYGLLSNNVNREIDRFETWIQNILDKYFLIKTKFIQLKE